MQPKGSSGTNEILNVPSLPPAAESRALVGAAVMWYTQGELGRAAAGLTRALALARGAGDMDVVAQAENLLGHVEHALGNRDAARDRFTRSVGRFRALAMPWGIGNALSGLAVVALCDRRRRPGGTPARSRPHRCFDRPARGS